MISGDFMYYGMNVVLAVVALLSVFLLARVIGDKGAKRKLIVGLLLLIVSGIIFSISLKVFRMSSIAYAGMALGKIDEATFRSVDNFKNIVLAGNVLEFLAVILLASISKMLVARRSGGEVREEGA